MTNPVFAGIKSRFAHLAGLGKVTAKSKAEDDDKDKKKDDESASAESDDEDEKMESDDDDVSASAEASEDDGDASDDDDDKKKTKKAKKAAADGDEKCEDDEKKDAKAERRGRRIERDRWAAIMSSPHAARNLQLAVTLAADTGKSSAHIIARLKDAGAASSSSDRRDRNPRIEPGSESAQSTSARAASSRDGAFARVAPKRRA